MYARLPLAVIVVVALSSCVPLPHSERLTPFVHGEISANGLPVEELPIRVVQVDAEERESRRQCEGRLLEAKTNAQGRFQFLPILERRLTAFVLGMAHCDFEWEVCIEQSDGWSVIDEQRDDYASCGVPASGPIGIVELRCTIDKGNQVECEVRRDLNKTPEKIEGWLTKK